MGINQTARMVITEMTDWVIGIATITAQIEIACKRRRLEKRDGMFP